MWQGQLSDLCPIDPRYNCVTSELRLDNRQIKKQDVFFACQGTQQHGQVFMPAALKAGAAAILIEADQYSIDYIHGIPHVYIPDLGMKAGKMAANYYAKPSYLCPLIGITGTNGKTSVNHFIAAALQYLDKSCGILGTLGYGVFPDLTSGQNTTPDALSVQARFAEFVSAKVDYLSMEVSSHALVQGRVLGCEFHTAVFTNLTQDHLDYHGNLENYGAAKQQLFSWQGLKYAVLNRDDAFSQHLKSVINPTVQIWDYSYMDANADLYLSIEQENQQGIVAKVFTPMGVADLDTRLVGRFNLSNLLAALGALLSMGLPLEPLAAALSQVRSVEGRMQGYFKPNQVNVVIDYAHTPDALAQVLAAMRPQCQGRLICLFGCGGDRDRDKRAKMGKIASQLADQVLLSNDNPRHENPIDIINDIKQGIDSNRVIQVEMDRQLAIQTAINRATAKDWLLIAGKGHENYQQIGAKKYPFSDEQVVLSMAYQRS